MATNYNENSHRVTEIDKETLKGMCSVCGPDTPLYFLESKNYYQCLERKRQVNRDAAKARYDPERNRKRELKRRFNMTLEQWDEIFESQSKKCAICSRTEPNGTGWHVDHDSTCCSSRFTCGNCVRGILCSNCNTALGLLGDDISKLESAITYLRLGLPRDPATGPLSTSQRLP